MKNSIKNLNDLAAEIKFCETTPEAVKLFMLIGSQLNDLVTTKDDLIKLMELIMTVAGPKLENIDQELEKFIITTLGKRLEVIIDDAATLKKIRGYCTGSYLIEAIKHKLPDMIVDAKSYADILDSLDSDYDVESLRKEDFFKATQYKLPDIIKNIDDLILILYSSLDNQLVILELVKPDILQNMINNLTNTDFKRLICLMDNDEPCLQDSLAQHKILTMLDGKIKNYIHTISDYNDFTENLTDSNKSTMNFLDLCHDKFLDSNNQITSSFNSFFKITDNQNINYLHEILSDFYKYFRGNKQIYLQAINQVNLTYRQMLENDIKKHPHTFLPAFFNSDKQSAEYPNRRKQIEISHLIENFIMNKGGNAQIEIDDYDDGMELPTKLYEIAKGLRIAPENPAVKQTIK